MGTTKRALLIGSSYDNLPGTENDVETIAGVLRKHGFEVDNENNVKKLCHEQATRQNILNAWEKVISDSSPGDIVVIYYSGHGGLAEEGKRQLEQSGQPQRIQFLVPSDFDPELVHWRGIMDSEISLLLLKTTQKTRNVTYILDCCHSARLGRAPHGMDARPKFLSSTYPKILRHMEQLRRDGKLKEGDNWTNPDVVRIAAAAADQTAWQYQPIANQWVGILTESLAAAISDPDTTLSWRNIMLGVRALVGEKFEKGQRSQQPRSAGHDIRIPFSIETSTSKALLAEIYDEHTILRGGRLHGLRKGDVYILAPFGTPLQTETARPAVTVIRVNGFAAKTSPVPRSKFPSNLALAIASKRSHRWPVFCPDDLPRIQHWLHSSTFFRPCGPGEPHLIELQRQGDKVVLHGQNVELGWGRLDDESSTDKLFSAAEMFSRAQDIISVEDGDNDELFRPDVEITIGLPSDGEEEILAMSRSGSTTEPRDIYIAENQRIHIRLENKSNSKSSVVHVSVFSIDAVGKTTLVTSAWEGGLPLSYELPRRVLKGNDDEGLPINWPESVPRQEAVEETFVFVMTSKEVLETLVLDDGREARGLDERASFHSTTPYHVTRIRYLLQPKLREIAASDLPTPDTIEEWKNSPAHPPGTSMTKGFVGAIVRTVKGIPSCVWVVNQHVEDITVVVSKYRPNRLLTGGEFNLSSTGAGFSFSTTTFLGPATRKTLAPQVQDRERSIAAFPFWTRKDGFGVITIFTGTDKILYIENDRIPVGSTVYFTNGPNLTILGYNEAHVKE